VNKLQMLIFIQTRVQTKMSEIVEAFILNFYKPSLFLSMLKHKTM